jgi:hypothetical protein
MTTTLTDPGPCGFLARTEANSEDGMEVTITVRTGCANIRGMVEALGPAFDAYDLCLRKPGDGPLYEYAREHFPAHASCPVISGILKAVEGECGLALKKDVSIRFLAEGE